LGGVCAGLEHYFKINALWFRLIFLLTLALGGSGVLVYIILWIIVPKALTTAEKLEMRGEDVNIQNIEKIIREEADYFKKKMHDFKNETKDYYTNRFKQKTENKFYGRRYHSTNYDSKHNNLFFRIIDFFISVIKYSIKALLIFIGLIFLFVGLILLSLLLSAILGHKIDLSINTVHLSGISLHQITSIFIDGPLATLGMIGLILLIGIPFLMLVYNGIRFLFNLNQRAKIFNSICTGLWIFAFIIILFVGWQVYMEFNAKAVSKWNNHIMQPKNAVLSLNMNNYGSTLFSNPNDSLYIINNSSIGFLNDSLVFAGFPELKIERSYNDSFQLQIIRIAYGYNSLDAAKRAKNILLNVVQKDSVLTLDNYVIFNKKDKWRAQKMKILLKVPLGKSVEMPVFIYNNLLKKDENEQFNFVYGPANIKFEMTENGLVRC
jgi:phage shock protein PspC (stress-responsive transcriptional regulator)